MEEANPVGLDQGDERYGYLASCASYAVKATACCWAVTDNTGFETGFPVRKSRYLVVPGTLKSASVREMLKRA